MEAVARLLAQYILSHAACTAPRPMNPARAALVVLLSLALVSCGAAGDDEANVDETSTESDALTSWKDANMAHDLAKVNAYRRAHGHAVVVLDKRLSTFAHAGSRRLMNDHVPHAHFIAAIKDGSLWTSGFRLSAGENQGDPHGWPKDTETHQIDQILKAMMDEGPGPGEAHGHFTNMMNPKFKRLGVGLVEDAGGKLYLTNDFSE
jgi:uncharacterized protein YkwD